MPLEELIAANTAATEKLTGMTGELLAEMKENNALLKRIDEGREGAIQALTAKDAPAKKPAKKAAAKKADPDPAPAEEPKTEDAGWNPDISVDGFKTQVTGYISAAKDEGDKKARVANMSAVLAELGAEAINPTDGKKHIEGDDDRRKAAFYFARFAAGLPVDFKADYDFNADPTTQATESAAAEDDGLGV